MELVAEANANVENRIAMGIISVSWSHQWIRNLVDRALRFHGLVDDEGQFLHDGPVAKWDPSRMDIRTNDVFSKRARSQEAGIYVSADKAREMADMVQQQRNRILQQGPGGTKPDLRTIYVGDSLPDLECLLAADIGILIRTATMDSEQHELSKALRRLGISFSWLGHYTQQRKAARLWWAQDLEEIVQSGILDRDGGNDRYEKQGEWHWSHQPAPTFRERCCVHFTSRSADLHQACLKTNIDLLIPSMEHTLRTCHET